MYRRIVREDSWERESSISLEPVRMRHLTKSNFSLQIGCMGISRLMTVIFLYLVIVLLHLFSAFDNSWQTLFSDTYVKTATQSVTVLLAFSHKNVEALPSILLSLFIIPLKEWHYQIPTVSPEIFLVTFREGLVIL